MESDGNPMHPAQRLQDAPRCRATAKRTGTPCMAPAVTGWTVCRMHGARGGAPYGKGNGMWRHGGRARDWIDERRMLNDLVREVREVERLVGSTLVTTMEQREIRPPKA